MYRITMQNWLTLIIVKIMYLHFVDCQDSVNNHNQSVYVTEGEFVTLSCGYKVSGFNGLKWYRQNPGEKPVELISLALDGNRTDGRVTADLQKKNSLSFLYIPTPSVTDSALYLCAVQAQCEELYVAQCINTS
ncbi:hypothetical protein FKM82_018299 [Ascaphus truei]